ncbi:MAG TPA: hypothetical protein PKA63_13785 [Oligoflexia bacterium]|nr:hypothetical protein [Oligoflexia bacterium]HMP49734.1 hypothetical protein [Oligoflexia bacterium]
MSKPKNIKPLKNSFLILSFFIQLAIISLTQKTLSDDNVKCSDNVCFKFIAAHDTNVLLPRLTKYKNIKNLELINATLDDWHKTLKCTWNEPEIIPEKLTDEYYTYLHYKDLGNSKFQVNANVSFIKADIFSISAKITAFCGGPYPVIDSISNKTFDLLTGKEVPFEMLFSNFRKNRRKIISTIFSGVIKKNGNKQVKNESKCDQGYDIEDLLVYPFRYNFSDQGLIVSPEYPNVLSACIIPALVSYSALKQYADENGILGRVIKLNESKSFALKQ